MEVRGGRQVARRNPVRAAHDEAASPATQPMAAAAVLPVEAQLGAWSRKSVERSVRTGTRHRLRWHVDGASCLRPPHRPRGSRQDLSSGGGDWSTRMGAPAARSTYSRRWTTLVWSRSSMRARGEEATPPYLVTEFVDGPTLAQWIRRSTLTESQTARLGAAMCRTLAYIHARGIVHCDVKPANILISGRQRRTTWSHRNWPTSASPRPATALALTTNGATMGSANYLSPEQVRGERITAATDIYSLGLVLIEALTGALAYPGTGVTAARPGSTGRRSSRTMPVGACAPCSRR